ncbi:hypothetical protein D3C75_192720 [compost metagenome]
MRQRTIHQRGGKELIGSHIHHDNIARLVIFDDQSRPGRQRVGERQRPNINPFLLHQADKLMSEGVIADHASVSDIRAKAGGLDRHI